jgi:putative PIN family toxin of toxin-antitoxin system
VGQEVTPLRAVLDTNVVVSALLFGKGRVSWLRTAFRSGLIVPVVSRATVQELVRVLEYPKFGLSRVDKEELLSDFLPFAQIVDDAPSGCSTVVCRDPHDQVFLDLAVTAGASALVTGDSDLLELAGEAEVSIMTPGELRDRVGWSDKLLR